MNLDEQQLNFPLSSELQEFLLSVESFRNDHLEYLNEPKSSYQKDISPDELKLAQMRFMYYHMHLEVEKLRQHFNELKYGKSVEQTVVYGPAPLYASEEYPVYQLFNGYTIDIE